MYEYVKGRGWIPYENPVFQMKCGTTVMVVPRKPELGEHYDWFYTDNSKVVNGQLDPHEMTKFYAGSTYENDLLILRDPEYWRLDDPVHLFVTFVPV
jgi:hypothetical protein